MLIEIHAIQNHSPANLNRDDLGAPKTCYFGGVLRSRISSQCIKRSIRMSEDFRNLLGGIRTRQLARVIAEQIPDSDKAKKRAEKILELCGFKAKKPRGGRADGDESADENTSERSKMLVYTTRKAVQEMVALLQNGSAKSDEQLADEFARLISTRVAVPDMALCGRMLEPDKSAKQVWKSLDATVNAALQVAHAISTHEARPLVDYYVAADDVPGEDAGAGYVDEAMFASACFYKYFSINWETLVGNLKGYGENHDKLAAHTVGAFIRGAARANPTGKQNSFAAHNPPDGMLVELKDVPVSYANAFASPATQDERDLISQSVAQLAHYAHDLDAGYGLPKERFWFSPNQRYPLRFIEEKQEADLSQNNFRSLDDLITAVLAALGYGWEEVRKVVVNPEVPV